MKEDKIWHNFWTKWFFYDESFATENWIMFVCIQMTLTCCTISSTLTTTQSFQLCQTIRRCIPTPATTVLSLVKTGQLSTVHKNITSFAKEVWHYRTIVKWANYFDVDVIAITKW